MKRCSSLIHFSIAIGVISQCLFGKFNIGKLIEFSYHSKLADLFESAHSNKG
jgi:hypothetical protein